MIGRLPIFAAAAAGAAALAPATASAADIRASVGTEGVAITITGEIRKADEEVFRRLTLTHRKAVVFLDSPGGQLVPALEIGRLIKLAGYPTVVTPSMECASACALIWLAGTPRFLVEGARVGFHASYMDVDGKAQEVGVANALVGRYLTQLDLPEKAVVFATTAPPTSLRWLTPANAAAAGISLEVLDRAEEEEEESPSATALASPAASTAAWFFVASSGSGTNEIATFMHRPSLRRLEGSKVEGWSRTVMETPRDRIKERRSLYRYDCSARTSTLLALTTFGADRRVIHSFTWESYEQETRPLAPESVGEAEWAFACEGPGEDHLPVEDGDVQAFARTFFRL